jgi:hypothetical protein
MSDSNPPHSVFLWGLTALLSLCPHSNAWASLGGSIDSIESDRKALSGRLSSMDSTGASAYSVQEIHRDGTRIQEYALPSGTVFAVSWRGPSEPDLSILLGSFFDEYHQSVSEQNRSSNRTSDRTARRHGRSTRVIRTDHMVLERSGHMRDVRGMAYLPELMPKGVHPEDLHE